MKKLNILILFVFLIVIMTGCLAPESINKSGNYTNNTQNFSNLPIKVTPIQTNPNKDPRYTDVRSDVFIDKSSVDKGDFLVIMARIWSDRALRDINYNNSISIELYRDNNLLKSGSVNIDTKTGEGDFIRKIDTADFVPDQYDILITFPGIGQHKLQFHLEPQNFTQCGSNLCEPTQECCNGWCYNPLEYVCCNGKLCFLCCDGACIDYHNSQKYPPGSCAQYDKAKVDMAGVKCGPGWCNSSNICCGGQCIPHIERITQYGTLYNYCGKQWNAEDYNAAAQLIMT